jgi:hypothetical protein
MVASAISGTAMFIKALIRHLAVNQNFIFSSSASGAQSSEHNVAESHLFSLYAH